MGELWGTAKHKYPTLYHTPGNGPSRVKATCAEEHPASFPLRRGALLEHSDIQQHWLGQRTWPAVSFTWQLEHWRREWNKWRYRRETLWDEKERTGCIYGTWPRSVQQGIKWSHLLRAQMVWLCALGDLIGSKQWREESNKNNHGLGPAWRMA